MSTGASFQTMLVGPYDEHTAPLVTYGGGYAIAIPILSSHSRRLSPIQFTLPRMNELKLTA